MKKYYIYDEFGDRYEVSNIKGMLNDIDDDGIEVILKPTMYFHELNKCLSELMDKNIIQKTLGEDYDAEAVDRAIDEFKIEVVSRFGQETLDEWVEDTMKQWENNKPDISKYK